MAGNLDTAELHFSGLIRTTSHSETQKIRIIEFFFANRLNWQFELEKIYTNGCFRLHIYLPANKTLIHLTNGEKIEALKRSIYVVQLVIRITTVRLGLLRPWTEVQYTNHLVVSSTVVTLCLPANFLYSLQLSTHSFRTNAGNSNEVVTLARNKRFAFLDEQQNTTARSERKATDVVLRPFMGYVSVASL